MDCVFSVNLFGVCPKSAHRDNCRRAFFYPFFSDSQPNYDIGHYLVAIETIGERGIDKIKQLVIVSFSHLFHNGKLIAAFRKFELVNFESPCHCFSYGIFLRQFLGSFDN